MRKSKIKMNVVKEDVGYSANCLIGDKLIATEGETLEELKAMILEAVNLAFEDEGIKYTIDEVELNYDLASFFAFYKVINAKALSERIGMNQSLLAQYIKGKKKPSAVQTRKILTGVRQIGRELSEVNFL